MIAKLFILDVCMVPVSLMLNGCFVKLKKDLRTYIFLFLDLLGKTTKVILPLLSLPPHPSPT